MPEIKENIQLVKNYFLERPDVSMVFVFGSYAKGREISESDFDIAIYFKPKGKRIEWQENQFYTEENRIWQDIERIVEIDTDLVVLNRVRPTVAFEILKTGMPLIIKDRKLYLEFYLTVSREAEDFREFIKDYWVTYQRSKSLSEEDKAKLIERTQFLDSEIQEFPDYRSLTLKTYKEDKFQRRNIERWIETLVISIIDVAKIILASEKKKMPSTYMEVLIDLCLLSSFNENEAREFAQFAKLRNILAHEYLDIRFEQVRKFIQDAEPGYKKLLEFVKHFVKQ
jgi:uncharacterized protein YutE (UPF0331/DUF86 family)/predicted nucleotidyltransferase